MLLRRVLCWETAQNATKDMEQTRAAEPGCERTRVLVVDDDPGVAALLERYLAGRGMEVDVAATARDLRDRIARFDFDVLLLDLGLPDGDGIDALRELRREWDGPLLIISGRGEVAERAIALELGADDFVPKPFDLRELLARINAVRRRRDAATSRARAVDVDGLHIDPEARTVTGRDGRDVGLTQGEFQLLLALLRRAGATVSRDQLMNELHGHGAGPYDRAIDVQVGRLRRKIERDAREPRLIQSVRGAGYRLGGIER